MCVALVEIVNNRRRPPNDPKSNQADVRQGGGKQAESPPGETPDYRAKNMERTPIVKPDRLRPLRKTIKPGLNESPQTEERMVESDLIALNMDNVEPATDPSSSPDPAITDPDANRDMLRIEIQTADPNIRIIWFAPKSDASPPK